MRYTLTRWFMSLPGRWFFRMSGRPQMTASGGRVFDPAGQFVVVNALKQGVFALDETKSAAELRAISNKHMKPFEKRPLRSIHRQNRIIDIEAGVNTQYKEFSSEGHGFMYADTTASARAVNAVIYAMFKPLL